MNRSPRTLVIGATGHVGRQVVQQLAAAGTAVRGLARNPAAQQLPAGAEFVSGDLSAPATLHRALDGVDAVFMTWPMLSADAANSVVEVISEHTNRIVLLSSAAVQDGVAEQDNPIGQAHLVIETPIRRASSAWTFLRPHGFATNTLDWAPQIRAGNIVRGAYGAASMTLLHEADIAAVAVRALTDEGHAGATYELTGPAALSRIDQVAAIGAALGRPLVWEEITPEQAAEQIRWASPEVAAYIVSGLATMLDTPGQTMPTVQQVTGSPARSFAQWAADHAADFA